MALKAVRNHGSARAILASVCISAMVASFLFVAGPAPAAVGCVSPPSILPVASIHAGMTGVGHTVLRGETIEPFDVEILGVMPDAIFLGVDIVVAEITGPAAFVEETGGAVAGMSGSPVFINGRLAGAVAWAVAEDRHIFGLTAAEDMVGIFELADGASGQVPMRIPLSEQVIETARAEGSMLTDAAALDALPVPLGVSSLGGRSLAQIEGLFAEHGVRVSAFRAASSAVPAPSEIDPTPFAPGGGLGAALSYGDASAFGFGTTTAVCGDIAIGFGHPMFWGIGEISLGMTDVDVIAIDNGNFWGTKIGTMGTTHGVLTQDRFAGVGGVFGPSPSLVPITSDVSSPDTGLSREGRTDVAWDEDWFVADAAYTHGWSNFTYVQQADAPGSVSYAFTISGTREGGAPFTVSNRWFEVNDFGAAGGVWRLADVLYTLTYNEFEPVDFTGIDMSGTITAEDLRAQIAAVRVSSPLQPKLAPRAVIRAEPGDRVTVEVTLARLDQGPDTVATFTVKVPRWAGGSEQVRLSGGRGRVNYRNVGSLDDLIAALNGGDHPNDLVVKGFGSTLLLPQDVGVQGKTRFTVRIVR
jgi:hypothetical protein